MKNVFAVDIGGSKLICGIVSLSGEIIKTHRTDFKGIPSSKEVITAITRGFKALSPQNTEHCGIAVPGLCDNEKGEWLYSPFSQMANIPITTLVEEITGLKAFADNDVNLCALAERYYGLCASTDDFLWMTVSNGIGGGLFLDGKLYRGKNKTAGEIGHLIVEEENGNICGCGNCGCLEAMASGASISKIYQQKTGKVISAKDIAFLAKTGDTTALEVYEKAAFYIGKAAAAAVNLLGIEKVIVGGGIALDFDLLKNETNRAFQRFVFKKANNESKVLPTSLGYYAALKGCAALVKDNLKEELL